MNIIWFCQTHQEYYLPLYEVDKIKHAECSKFDLQLRDVVIFLNHYHELRNEIGLFYADGPAWKLPT